MGTPAAPASTNRSSPTAAWAQELVQHLREGVAVHDADGRLVEWNAAATTITGWTRAEAAERFPRALPDGLHEIEPGRWIDTRCLTLDGDPARVVSLFDDASALIVLRESEARWRAAFEASAVGMALLSPAGRFTRVNPALCALVGYSAQELHGRTFADITHPDDVALDRERAARLLQGEMLTPDREKRYIHRAGHVVWVTVAAAVVRDERGEPSIVAQLIDITARKRVEAALLASEARFRAAVEGSLDAFFIFGALRDATSEIVDYEILDMNTRGCETLGLTRAELLGQRLFERFPLMRATDLPQKYARVIATRQPLDEEFNNPMPGVAGRWLQHQLVPLADGLAITTRDITARKLAEATTRASEERFRALSASAPVGIYLTDVQGLCLYVNARWQEIAGLTLAESLGADWARAIHPDDSAAVFAAWQAAVAEEREFLLEYRFRTPDGVVRWVRSRAAAIGSTASGAPTGYVGTVEDISEQRHAEEALTIFAAQLEVKTREQEAFIYTVAHDLRSPLVSIHGLAGLLAEDYAGQLDEDGQHFINRIVLNVARMNALLDDLLTLSRIGSVDCERELVDLNEIWQVVAEQLEQQLAARGADVAIEGRLPVVTANPTRMTQVFQNLLDNALSYTPAERAPVVRVRASEHPGHWELIVSDQGVGVPPAFRRKLFEIFQRLPEGKTLHPDGNGVGLAVVKRVIETHGGELWVESAPGGGAEFHCTLPKVAGG